MPNFSRLGEAISFVTAASDANEAMLDDLETMRFHQVAIEKSLSKSSRIKTVMGIGKEANASKIADFVGKYAQEMESL